MTRTFQRRILTLAALIAAAGFAACDDGGNGVAPPVPLTPAAKAALDEALQDAYRTYYTYDAVVVEPGGWGPFPDWEPFPTVLTDELSFIVALTQLYGSRNLSPPASIWNAGNVEQFADLVQACVAAEESEVATELMFERLLRVQLPDDLRAEFTRQRETASNTHRLAFRNCVGGSIQPVNLAVQAAMIEALQDEYRAYYTYQRVTDDLGETAPFVAIHDAEWMHVGAVSNLFVKRGLGVPASLWSLDNVPRFATLQAACAGGTNAETENVAMYDRLLLLELPADVERVFENLREASLERHLPAFQACD